MTIRAAVGAGIQLEACIIANSLRRDAGRAFVGRWRQAQCILTPWPVNFPRGPRPWRVV